MKINSDVSNIDVSIKLLNSHLFYFISFVPLPFVIHQSAIDEGDSVEKNSKNDEILPYKLVYAAFPSNTQIQ